MGFLKKLFGGEKKPAKYVDTRGIYFFVRCDNCGTITRLRADKEHDLSRFDGGYSWHKTIVDNSCFRPIPVVVHLNSNYQPTSEEISGGSFVSQEEYEKSLRPSVGKEPGDVGDATDQESSDK